MALLADHTGWSERFIFEELLIARGMQYIHAYLVSNDVQCRWVIDKIEEQNSIKTAFDRMIKARDEFNYDQCS